MQCCNNGIDQTALSYRVPSCELHVCCSLEFMLSAISTFSSSSHGHSDMLDYERHLLVLHFCCIGSVVQCWGSQNRDVELTYTTLNPEIYFRVLSQFAVYAAYRNRLETAFLADQLASAISTADESHSSSKLGTPEKAPKGSRPASSTATPQQSAPSSPTKAALANGEAPNQSSVSVLNPHGGVSIGTPVQPPAEGARSECASEAEQQNNSGESALHCNFALVLLLFGEMLPPVLLVLWSF